MNSTIPADLLELKARFETWRTNRKYMREPIPDELWKAAADLSRRYPTSLVGRVLKLDPTQGDTQLDHLQRFLVACSGARSVWSEPSPLWFSHNAKRRGLILLANSPTPAPPLVDNI